MKPLALTPLALTVAAASVAITGLAAPALADQVQKTEDVTYADLNLNTMEGQQTLERRVEIAARRVCQMPGDSSDIRQRKDVRKCLAKARAKAAQKVAAVIADERRGG